ncbi:excinuclease ABC subunit C, partial [Mycobacterium tuberculosis]|nr:excinuclease ABC subunit C [Mycobacterium tuberculosis]
AYSGLDAEAIPKEILVDTIPADLDSLESWLSRQRGSKVSVRVPERGEKKAVLETVTKNAKEALVQHKLKRSSDLTTRSAALK